MLAIAVEIDIEVIVGYVELRIGNRRMQVYILCFQIGHYSAIGRELRSKTMAEHLIADYADWLSESSHTEQEG